MSTKLRWGLLSTARINAKLIPAIRLAKRSQLSAIASRDMTRALKYAAEWEIPHAYGSYQEMLASDTVDAVYISLPNDQHAEWAVRALEAGKHVLCEKPFATKKDEVDQMIAAAHSSGCVLAEAFMYVHHPQTAIVLDLVRSGKIGTIHTVKGCFHFKLNNLDDIRANLSMGGGSIWDVGVYPLSFTQLLMQASPSEVTGWQHTGTTGVDMTFAAQMRYEGGALAQFTSSFETPFQMGMDILGSDGIIKVTRPFSGLEEGRVDLIPLNGVAQRVEIPPKHLYLGEVEDVEMAVFDGKKQRLSLGETSSHIRTVLALLQSARENHPISCGWSLD